MEQSTKVCIVHIFLYFNNHSTRFLYKLRRFRKFSTEYHEIMYFENVIAYQLKETPLITSSTGPYSTACLDGLPPFLLPPLLPLQQ